MRDSRRRAGTRPAKEGKARRRTGSRTPFQILADYYQASDTRDRDLWQEYSQLTRGLAAVRWSRGLRATMLGTIDNERTDEELAADDVAGEVLASVEAPVWSRIRRTGLEHALLVAAERGGLAAVDELLRGDPPADPRLVSAC